MSSFPTNPDVIVIGAGASGLSAADALQRAGFTTLVLEADDHVGGRCITDTSTFSAPFDRGGSWFHSAEINPLAKMADELEFPLHKQPWIWNRVVSEGTPLNKEQVQDYTQYMDAMWDRIVEKGSGNTSLSNGEVLPDGPWKDTAKLFIAHMLGGDWDVTSPNDMATYADAEGDWLVGGGLGNFIKYIHSGIAVELNCPVSKIDHSGTRVRVTTPKGIVEADRVIVTVSVGVLAAEKMTFNPPLPSWKLQAIDDLPNGLLNKVGIEFDPTWKEAHEGLMVDYHTGGEHYCCLAFRFYDSELATGFTGGRFADFLEKEGPGAATEFCLEALRETFGNDALKHVIRTSETAWRGNPYTYGSYSYLSPGCAGARESLAETIDDKIFFAGEATLPTAFATVHGAYLSGKQVVARMTRNADEAE